MNSPIDSLRISNRECDELLRTLEQSVRSVEDNNNLRGENDRVEVGSDIIAVVKLLPPEGRPTQFRIRCRNISSSGIGFLHGQFVHENTPCEIILINAQQHGFLLPAKVVRCRFIEKHIHEIGIAFAQPIDFKQILGTAA